MTADLLELKPTEQSEESKWLHGVANVIDGWDIEHVVLLISKNDGGISSISAREIRRDQLVGMLQMITIQVAVGEDE